MKKIKLFCLPYAGGTASIYNKWKKSIKKNIEICPIDLPGRGNRFNEPLCQSMNDVVNDIFHRIRNSLDIQPYAFFGYSMGSWISYELIRKALKSGYRPPVHAFFAAKDAPQVISKREKMHLLEHDVFVQRIMKLGGTPEGLFENDELMEIFMEILRTDYKVVETYSHEEKESKINCNISVLYGTEDNYPTEDIEAWAHITNGECTLSGFDDGHFFINNYSDEIINIINSTL